MNRNLVYGLLLVALCALAGCAQLRYTWDGKTYNNRDEALAGGRRDNAEAEAAISTQQNPLVNRKLLIIAPTAAAYSRTFESRVTASGKRYATPGTPARAQDDFVADALAENSESIRRSIVRANIFREVELKFVDSTSPNIQASDGQDVLMFYLGQEGGSLTLFYINARYGKQVLAVDQSTNSLPARRLSLINELKAKALQ